MTETTGPIWIIPFEAVRASTDNDGTHTLVELAGRHAEFKPHATVELASGGFLATVQYQLPGFVLRTEKTKVLLCWSPQENRL